LDDGDPYAAGRRDPGAPESADPAGLLFGDDHHAVQLLRIGLGGKLLCDPARRCGAIEVADLSSDGPGAEFFVDLIREEFAGR